MRMKVRESSDHPRIFYFLHNSPFRINLTFKRMMRLILGREYTKVIIIIKNVINKMLNVYLIVYFYLSNLKYQIGIVIIPSLRNLLYYIRNENMYRSYLLSYSISILFIMIVIYIQNILYVHVIEFLVG